MARNKTKKESLNNVGKKVESLPHVYVDDLMVESILINKHLHINNNNVKALFCLYYDDYK